MTTALAWRPDVRTIEWALSVIDEEAVGRMVSESLSNRGGDPGRPPWARLPSSVYFSR